MPEERFQTETILRETTVGVERPVEVDAEGNSVSTETVELPANERIEVTTCERYPGNCPRRGGVVAIEEAVVVGVDMVDEPTGTDAAVALAYCPECAASEFGYARDPDGARSDADGRSARGEYGYLFGLDERSRGGSSRDRRARGVGLALLLILGGVATALGGGTLVPWAVLVTATVAGAVLLVTETERA